MYNRSTLPALVVVLCALETPFGDLNDNVTDALDTAQDVSEGLSMKPAEVIERAEQTGESVEEAAEDALELAREGGYIPDEVVDKAFASAGTTRDAVIARITRVQSIPQDHDDFSDDAVAMSGLLAILMGLDLGDSDGLDEEYDDLD